MLRSQRAAAGDHGGVFDRMLEFADVARPGPAAEGGQKLLRHGLPRPSGGMLGEHMCRERVDVVAAGCQWRHVNRKHMEPMVEVFTKRPRGDRRHEVAVGRGDHADIERPRRGRAHRRDLPILQRPQELHLQVERRLADLVEEQRAAICHGEQAETIGGGAGEGAADVAEEFALDHAWRQCTETGGHKRPVPPRTVGVDGAGGQILAGAGLAGDEHG